MGLNWVTSSADPWLSEHGDTGRIFLAGDSAGGNIVHNIAIMAGTRNGLAPEAQIEGAILLHPMFGGKQPIHGECMEKREQLEKLWNLVCPDSIEGLDDPRLNPISEGAPSLQTLACRRLFVCSAEKDYACQRAVAYYQAVKASGLRGTVDWFESKGEEHVFFIHNPKSDQSLVLVNRLVAFLDNN